MAAEGPQEAPGRGSGAHRRRRRLWLGLLGGVIAVLVAGSSAFAILPRLSDGAADRSGAGPAGSSAPATVAPTVASPDPSGVVRGDPPQQQPPPIRDRSGFPDAATTGVPAGVELRPSESIVVDDDGAVVENLLLVDGTIEVRADRVTIRNVRVTNQSDYVEWGIIQHEGYGGLVIEDSEVFGNGVVQFRTGINNDGGEIEIRRVEVHRTTDAIMTSHGVIEDSYLHSPTLFKGDHTDMIQTVGGSPYGLPLSIRGNTIVNTEPQTSAILLDDVAGDVLVPVSGVLVEGNLLAGGGYTVYGAGFLAEGHDPSDIVIRGNVFSRELWPTGGYYGPVAYFDLAAPGNVWSGNVWQDDGTPVRADRPR